MECSDRWIDFGSLFTINSHSISLTGSFTCFLLIPIVSKCLFNSLLTLLYIFSFLLCIGDIKPNAGHRKLKQNSDHLNNVKRGGVYIYYKEFFPVPAINLSYFNEVLLLEISQNNNKVIVSVIYRSPSQKNDEE